MANDIQVRNNSLPVTNVNDLVTIGTVYGKSGMMGCNTIEAGIVLAINCFQTNTTPLEFIETFNMIGGIPCKKADAMLVRLEELGGEYNIIERTTEKASIEVKFKKKTYTSTFTWTEAQLEQYIFERDGKTLKKNWRTPKARQQSLWARVCSDAIRTVCPQAVKGVYTPEEMTDISDEVPAHTEMRNITPEAVIMPQTVKPVKTEEAPPVVVTAQAEIVPPAQAAVVPPTSTVIPDSKVDFNIIPTGNEQGLTWSVLTLERLKKAYNSTSKFISDQHKAFIKIEIERKEKETAVNGK